MKIDLTEIYKSLDEWRTTMMMKMALIMMMEDMKMLISIINLNIIL